MASIYLRVRLTPKAGRNEIVRRESDILHARVSAPPVDGAANRALLELLSDTLDIRKSSISLKSGATSRDKLIEIMDIETDSLWEKLERAITSAGRRST